MEGVSLLFLQASSVFQAEWSSPGVGPSSTSWIVNNMYQRVCVAEGVNIHPQTQICWESEAAPAGTKTTAAGLKKSSNTFLTFQILLHFHHTRTTNPDLMETVINRQKHPVEDWGGNQSAVTRRMWWQTSSQGHMIRNNQSHAFIHCGRMFRLDFGL